MGKHRTLNGPSNFAGNESNKIREQISNFVEN